jgi:hypothetical protein
MSGLVVTIIITVILVLLAVAGLSIGLILTGKSRLDRGACGRIPQKKRDDHCGQDIVCPLCKPAPKKKEDKHDDNSGE